MAYRVNGKTYISLDQAKKAAEKIFSATGNIVAIEKSERGIFKAQARQERALENLYRYEERD